MRERIEVIEDIHTDLFISVTIHLFSSNFKFEVGQFR